MFEPAGDPYAEGFDAAKAGAPLDSNPNPVDEKEARSLWDAGWNYAHEKDD